MEALRPPRKSDYCADRRVRELYRYFRPSRHLVQSQPTDDLLGDPLPDVTVTSSETSLDADDDHHFAVLGAHDTTLSSFAQLAALRLNAQRAMIWYAR